MDTKKLIFILSSVLLIFAPLIVLYFSNLVVVKFSIISAYGIYIIFYTLIQITFAHLNRRKMEKISNDAIQSTLMYNILVVGYREDPILYKKCLESLKDLLHDKKIAKIIAVIDGNTEEDIYMADIFTEIFGEDGTVMDELLPESKAICITQEHAGKRHVLYTGLKISCDMKVHGVICTDSDTIFKKDAAMQLAKVLESDPNIGAVTGYVEILNKDSVISYLSYLRYWFACNLERAYQSYNECVLCVSGPLGVYRVSLLDIFLDDWLNQKFMGKECTYGDDRHLTNNILMLGYKVLYTHKAVCYTDTPVKIDRFFNQQVRWCKSSYREVVWTLKCIDKHSLWLTIDLIYQSFYSFVVLASLIYILLTGTFFQMMIYIFTIVLFNTLKGIYAVAIEKKFYYLLYGLYGFLYITIVVPCKIFAGFTLSDINWGTSSRNLIVNNINFGHLTLVMWNGLLLSGIIFNIYKNVEFFTYSSYITVSVLAIYMLICGIVLLKKINFL